MRRGIGWQCNETLRKVLAIFLSVALALGSVPVTPALAEELDAALENLEQIDGLDQNDQDESQQKDESQVEESDGGEAEQNESDEAATDDAAVEQTEQLPKAQQNEKAVVEENEEPGEETEDEEEPDEADFEGGKLSKKIKVDDDHYFKVVISYDDEANIPEGAELHVIIPELDGAKKERKQRLGKILELEDGDRILGTEYLDVSIEADGKTVTPASEVEVTVQTNTIKAARSAALEIALGMEGAQGNDAEQHVIPENRTKDKKGAHTALTFSTEKLGRIAIACVVAKQELWTGNGLEVSLLTPRYGMTVEVSDAAAPSLDEGVDLLACYATQVDPAPAYGTNLWIAARRIAADDDQATDASVGVTAYRLLDGASEVKLFGPEGTKQSKAVRAGDKLLLVWDSGYRSTTLSMSDVTIEGMMPEGTQGEAHDVTQNYEDPTALLRKVDAEAATEVATGTREVSTIAAYDITLEADGDEYQPDEEHPLTVTIANETVDEAIAAGKQVQVWHVADDKTIDVIDDYRLEDGVISFEAPGFSDYILVAQAETDTVMTSTTFNIRASAKGYARASLVTFTDTDGNPIRGTVTGTLDIAYTGGGSEANETNSIDMYSFIDKLDPTIADEYDFSRVYVQLRNDQKDFRRIMVGDNTAIGGSDANPYRAYFHMNDVSENAAGHDYNGTWYQLSIGGKMDDIYIEFYHVAPATFHAIDMRNDPVEGATFALYTDAKCLNPFEYKDEAVTAVSDSNGVVSFGKIPRGTYYMKETVVPEGYKKTTSVHTIVVDGETAIADVVHEDDDGSIIIADVLEMTLTKEWGDNKDHQNESVLITVYAQGEVVEAVTLNAQNNWTQTLSDLDPNEAYMISETSVTSNGRDVTQSWIPTIEFEERDSHAEYYKADEFQREKQYVVITTTQSGTRALIGGSSLTTTPLTVSADGSKIAGTVTDEMLWNVESLTQDGVIALRNEKSGKYLDQNGKWYLNPEYPVPLYMRHSNDDGQIRFYHRANMNNAIAYYLYMWYSGAKEGQVDRYWNDASQAGVFELYRKVNVRTVDVTITNKATEYPIRIRNLTYPQGAALPNMTFDLYSEEDYGETNPGTPLISSLTANANGYLENAAGESLLELSAGQYLLVQTSTLEDEGFVPLSKPVKFTITRRGALRVAQTDQEFTGFTYSTTMTEGETTIPVLQVPNNRPGTLELTLDVQGEYADQSREFEFELTIPEGVNSLSGTLDGETVTFDEDNHTFVLKHGQTLRLEGVPAAESYVFTQTNERVAAVKHEGDGLYEATAQATPAAGSQSTVTVTQDASDARIVTISGLRSTSDDPARVTIINELPDEQVLPTGINDNAPIWAVIAAASLCALALLWLRRRRFARV
ncbi:MAG: hypothetical protein IKG11_02315 [Atopobiaceae bacterium]|nr:hypothetical protein [Atopobiaceae bacterium]